VWLLLPAPGQRISRQPCLLDRPNTSIRSGSQVSSCVQEPILIERIEQGLEVSIYRKVASLIALIVR